MPRTAPLALMIGLTGLPHQPVANEPPPSPRPIIAMEVREGRIGNAFACERCRKHKVRCVPSDTTGICQRCQKARVECIEHVARRRPAKPRGTVAQTPARAADVESKLDMLSAIVTSTSAPSPALQPTLPPVTTLPSQMLEKIQRTPTPAPLPPPASAPPASKTPILPNPGSAPESALSFWESINDTISGMGRLDPVLRSISVVHMQLLLDTYRAMADFFPFVALPNDAFCRDLMQQRPMLMFAVLTVASYDSALLQLTLSRELRKVVMVKIMNGEKSLDLLQGLLVFIAWHHHYMDPQAVSIHMLLQMCLGIAGDLGLDRIPPTHAFAKEDVRDREAKRAYLGCYYLSTNMGVLEPGRTRNLAYSSTLRAYASDLASTWEYKSDSLLPILVDTCQFIEDVEETFRSTSEQALVARSQVKRLSDRWESMRSSSKQLGNDFKTLQWLQMAAKVHLYRIATSLEFADRDSTPWASGYQLSLRISSVRAVEQFLECSTQMNPSQYEFLSIVDWLNLIFTLTTLGKLALHSSPMPGWDPVDLQLSKTLDHYRDQLCAQMPRPLDVQDRKAEDVFERFRRITAIMKGAMRSGHGRGSPNGSTFEITTSSRQTVSLLQDLPPLKSNGMTNGDLPAPWKVNPQFDVSSIEFPWKFLMGSL
ncbi:hypothetical protein P154DRAFT_244687 [Amniculicola lignicola CBS 123094]|uniref:Zn(2)-C6 fungal-type domain-containing protein n=1 Tax=Amniculicola lignicola CBS 123094 TaxID=1392246 RepID=A0A6A5WAW2_9PLEO|nr:hypothetical protein P154DRAFT_244687 [Amniculicola lignicola CBS 123094]